MATLSTNPFESAKVELLAALATTPAPPGYKTRIFFLIGLCGLQFVLCILHLIFTFIDLRRRGKNPWLIRFQRVREGRMVAVNALVLYSLLNAASAILLAVQRWRYYDIYFLDGGIHNIGILIAHSVTPAILAGCCYTFSNLSALAAISRGLASQHASRTAVIMHNLALPLMIGVYLACSIPLGIVTNNLVNSVPGKAAELLVLLTTASQTLQTACTPAQLASLTKMGVDAIARGEDIKAVKAMSEKTTIGLVALSSVYSIAFAIANVASLSLALKLRDQSRLNRSRDAASLTSRQLGSLNEGTENLELQMSPKTTTGFNTELSQDNATQPSSPLRSKAKGLSRGRAIEHGESAALTRLSYDLMVSLPILLVIGVIFPALGVFAVSRHDDKRWSYNELRQDLFVWIQVITVSVVVGYFLINLFLHPGKYGQGDEKSTKASNAAGTFRPVVPEALHITKLSVADFNTFEAGSTHKDGGASMEGEKYQEKW